MNKSSIPNLDQKTITMTKEEQAQVWSTVVARTFLQEDVSVRKPVLSRLYYRGLLPVLRQQGVSFRREKYMFATVFTLLIVSGSLSVFAEETLPGDFLYPIKINLNENLQVVLAVTPEEKAKAEAVLATKRLEELERLALLGKLNTQLVTETNNAFETHVSGLTKQLTTLEQKKDFESIAKVGVFFQTRIAVHAAVLKDIEAVTVSTSENTNQPKVRVADIVHVEKKILGVIAPTVEVTEKALLETSLLSQDTRKNTEKIILYVDHDEAKDYIQKLNKEIGTPSLLLESVSLPVLHVFVPNHSR